MRTRAYSVLGLFLALVLVAQFSASGQNARTARRNVIIFVADGLRHGSSTNERDMPNLSALRREGVDFQNSYSMFPTFTMANASAIATGHRLGDTGIFSNYIWLGYQAFDTGNFKTMPTTPAPFLENDNMLGDIGAHLGRGFPGPETFLATARAEGYNTAAIGKLGPAAFQEVSAIRAINGEFPVLSQVIVVDDSTGPNGVPLPADVLARFREQGVATEAPTRSNGYAPNSRYNNGYTGGADSPGTLAANVVQQDWFIDVATRVVLPFFESQSDHPFALLYWSRDPDGSQHFQGDSFGRLSPGINGPTSRLGVQNADRNLGQLLAWLNDHPAIKATTDVLVTSDHGFATISRREIDRNNRVTASEAGKRGYADGSGRVETGRGILPVGFLAIDLALDLRLDMYDPDRRTTEPVAGTVPYRRVQLAPEMSDHPMLGNALLGENLQKVDGSDAKVIVAANGGSDLIYIPDGDRARATTVVSRLLTYDYVGGVFVDDRLGEMPGTLPMSAIGLVGSTILPRPSIVVAMKVFYLNPEDLQTGIQVTDAGLQHGQGYHGGFGRESTFNTMAALGPDFKSRFVDRAPMSNADIAPTLARILGFEMPPYGSVKGRAAQEALAGNPDPPSFDTKVLASAPANGMRTVLYYQEHEGERYGQTACLLPAAQQDISNPAVCRR